MEHHAEDSVVKRLRHVEYVLVWAEGQATWMSQLAIYDWLEHADAEVDGEDASGWVLNRTLTKGTAIGEEEAVVLLRKHHGVWSLQAAAIEVLNHWRNLNSIISYSQAQDGLMGLVCHERRALLVEHNTRWLSTCAELNLHGTFLVHLEDVSIGGHAEEVALRVFGGTVQWHR